MNAGSNYFWQNLKYFANQIACIDTSIGKSVTYADLETDSNTIAGKIKLSKKALIFLFTSNIYDCIATYIGILKSGNAVLLLDEKLNDEIRNDLIITYKPEFVLTSNETPPENYSLYFNQDSFGYLTFMLI